MSASPGSVRHRIRLHVLALGAGLAVLGSARASTPGAWAAHAKQVVASCVGASHLRNARPAGDLIEFDDDVGFTALVIVGQYPQRHMHNRRGRLLCLFDKRSGSAYMSDADRMIQGSGPSP